MENGFAKYFLLQYFLSIVVLAVVSRTAAVDSCRSKTDNCLTDSVSLSDLTKKDLDRILGEWRITRKFKTEDKKRLCKFDADLKACYESIKGPCGNNEYFKFKLSTSEGQSQIFDCAAEETCLDDLILGVFAGVSKSKITLSQIQLIKTASESRKYLIAQMGRVKGCEFVNAFMDRYNKIKDKCVDDSGIKPFLDTTKDIQTQLRCEQTNAPDIKKCEDLLNECKGESMDENQQKQINQIIWKILGMKMRDLIEVFGKSGGCKLVKNFQVCQEKKQNSCLEKELYFKPIFDITKSISTQFDCDGKGETECGALRDKCIDRGISETRVEQNEFDEIIAAAEKGNDDSLKKLIDDVGNEEGCKFIKVFENCQSETNNLCSVEESHFKMLLEITKMAKDHLHCGCSTAAITLLLIFASVLLSVFLKFDV